MLLNYNQGTTIMDINYAGFAAFVKNDSAAAVTPVSGSSNLHYHFVFRSNFDLDELKDAAARQKIYRFVAGCVEVMGGTVEAVGGKNEDVHLLISLDIAQNPADFARRLKMMSAAWAKRHIPFAAGFTWGEEEISTVSQSQCEYLSARIKRQSKTFLRKKVFTAH